MTRMNSNDWPVPPEGFSPFGRMQSKASPSEGNGSAPDARHADDGNDPTMEQLDRADRFHEGMTMLRGIQSLLCDRDDLWFLRPEELYMLLDAVRERLNQGKPDYYSHRQPLPEETTNA